MVFFLKIFQAPLRGAWIFGVDDAIVGGVVAGLGAAGGAAMNASSAQNINRENVAFAREQTAQSQGFAREGMRFNREERIAAQQFAERMSSTAYQRAIADAKAAGLNPILTAAGGSASAPTVGAASAGGSSVGSANQVNPEMGEALSRLSSTAQQTMLLNKELQSRDAGIALDKASTLAKVTEAKKNVTTAKGEALANKVLETRMPQTEAEAKREAGQASWDMSFQGFDNWVKRIGNVADTVLGVINPFSAVRKAMDYKYQRPQQPGVPYPPGSPGRHSYMNRSTK